MAKQPNMRRKVKCSKQSNKWIQPRAHKQIEECDWKTMKVIAVLSRKHAQTHDSLETKNACIYRKLCWEEFQVRYKQRNQCEYARLIKYCQRINKGSLHESNLNTDKWEAFLQLELKMKHKIWHTKCKRSICSSQTVVTHNQQNHIQIIIESICDENETKEHHKQAFCWQHLSRCRTRCESAQACRQHKKCTRSMRPTFSSSLNIHMRHVLCKHVDD